MAMANSSGLNERPSRTSLRGVATLYQGSITILLRSLHAREERGRRALQTREIRVGHRLEFVCASVHPVADPVGNNHVARDAERFHVPLGLLERAFHAGAQALRLDYEVTVLWRARERPEDRD